MSFENIQLPDFLLADLYKDCLVELETVKSSMAPNKSTTAEEIVSTQQVTPPHQVHYLGENKKQITIIVKDDDAAFIKDSDLQFLTNVLKACDLTLGDISIVNIAKHPLRHNQLSEQLQAKYTLLFDVEPGAIYLPFTIPDFQPQAFADCTYLKAPALHVINQSTEDGKLYKTKLWMNLRKLFGL